jgi:hypothetical protein
MEQAIEMFIWFHVTITWNRIENRIVARSGFELFDPDRAKGMDSVPRNYIKLR